MVSGIFHSGSGLGNQLFRYCATRVLALDKGYDFSMIAPENFKGKDFMNLDMGVQEEERYSPVTKQAIIGIPYWTTLQDGKVHPMTQWKDDMKPMSLWEEKTPYFNPDFNFIEDNTIIDGNFEDERYFGHRLKEIDGWLSTSSKYADNAGTCAIGFRGGEYQYVPELFLPKEYWAEAIVLMLQKNINMKFEVHTDDEILAKQFFPEYKIIHDIEKNWCVMRGFRYAIIANSSFYVLPRLLKHADNYPPDYPKNREVVTIAPRYWNRYNVKRWDFPQSYYKQFQYI